MDWTYEHNINTVKFLEKLVGQGKTANEIVSMHKKIIDLLDGEIWYGSGRKKESVFLKIKNILAYITNGEYNFNKGTKDLKIAIDNSNLAYDHNTKLIYVSTSKNTEKKIEIPFSSQDDNIFDDEKILIERQKY